MISLTKVTIKVLVLVLGSLILFFNRKFIVQSSEFWCQTSIDKQTNRLLHPPSHASNKWIIFTLNTLCSVVVVCCWCCSIQTFFYRKNLHFIFDKCLLLLLLCMRDTVNDTLSKILGDLHHINTHTHATSTNVVMSFLSNLFLIQFLFVLFVVLVLFILIHLLFKVSFKTQDKPFIMLSFYLCSLCFFVFLIFILFFNQYYLISSHYFYGILKQQKK